MIEVCPLPGSNWLVSGQGVRLQWGRRRARGWGWLGSTVTWGAEPCVRVGGCCHPEALSIAEVVRGVGSSRQGPIGASQDAARTEATWEQRGLSSQLQAGLGGERVCPGGSEALSPGDQGAQSGCGGTVSLHRVELLLKRLLGPAGRLRHFTGEPSVNQEGSHGAIHGLASPRDLSMGFLQRPPGPPTGSEGVRQ